MKSKLLAGLLIVCLLCVLLGFGIASLGLGTGFGLSFLRDEKVSFGNDVFRGEWETKTIALSDFQNLDLNLSLVRLEISEGESFELRYVKIPQGTIQYKQTSDMLTIWSRYEKGINYQIPESSKVYLTIPSGSELSVVNLNISMGDFVLDGFQSKNMTIGSSMSNVEANDIVCEKLKISGSMANIEFHGVLHGSAQFNNSMGNTEITAIGNVEDYFFDINNSMGSIDFNNKDYKEWKTSNNVNQQANHHISISNSMGNVSVKFKGN